jgi:two-component system catabolic regulation response regulator CreB
VWCGTGVAALEALRQSSFALAVLDVGLPDVNGFDLFREIHRLWPLPVIFLTARSGEIDRVVGLELGADDYILKPFSPTRSMCGCTHASAPREAIGEQHPRFQFVDRMTA